MPRGALYLLRLDLPILEWCSGIRFTFLHDDSQIECTYERFNTCKLRPQKSSSRCPLNEVMLVRISFAPDTSPVSPTSPLVAASAPAAQEHTRATAAINGIELRQTPRNLPEFIEMRFCNGLRACLGRIGLLASRNRVSAPCVQPSETAISDDMPHHGFPASALLIIRILA